MKKILFLLFLSGVLHEAFSQGELQRALHKYYRHDPFETSFGNFINDLLLDPALTRKTVVKRTDSTLFFFVGEYKGHNPFGFKAIRTEIRLAEMEIESTDTIPKKDTILAYQLLGYINKDAGGPEAVRTEYIKFGRKFGEDFSNKVTRDLLEDHQVTGATCNYFLNTAALSPLTIVWGKINGQEYVFAITVRLIKIENQATLPQLYFNGR